MSDPVVNVGATWASGGDLNTGSAYTLVRGTSGTQAQPHLSIGRCSNRDSYPTVSNETEQYDGSSWTEVG